MSRFQGEGPRQRLTADQFGEANDAVRAQLDLQILASSCSEGTHFNECLKRSASLARRLHIKAVSASGSLTFPDLWVETGQNLSLVGPLKPINAQLLNKCETQPVNDKRWGARVVGFGHDSAAPAVAR